MNNIKVAMLASARSIHSIRWARALANKGIVVHLISLKNHKNNSCEDRGIFCHVLDGRNGFGYVFSVKELRRLLKKINPDFIHAHYVSGYGLLARLVGYKPVVLSVWGSDIYAFPKKSCLHKYLLKNNLKNADYLTSTSRCMAEETKKYTKKDITVIPFGIEINDYIYQERDLRNKETVVFGIIKGMADQYGIRQLLDAYEIVYNAMSVKYNKQTQLIMVGDGEKLDYYKSYVLKLQSSDTIKFVGRVDHKEVPNWLTKIDIFCSPSLEESFGVAVLEAMVSGVPVVVSDAPGLMEVTEQGLYAEVVKKNNVEDLKNKMIKLATNFTKYCDLSKRGREFVLENYDWKNNVAAMIKVYERVVSHKNILFNKK